jgi:hypothetical protein
LPRLQTKNRELPTALEFLGGSAHPKTPRGDPEVFWVTETEGLRVDTQLKYTLKRVVAIRGPAYV